MKWMVPVLKSDWLSRIRSRSKILDTHTQTTSQLNCILLRHVTKNPCVFNGIIFDSNAARMDHRAHR